MLLGAQWRDFLVHAVLQDKAELPIMQTLGIELIPYRLILNDLCNDSKNKRSSVATGIVEMLNFLK